MSIDLDAVRAALTHLPLPSGNAEFNAILAADHHRREHAALEAIGGKAAILAALATGGVTIVTATYDGYGDSGQFEEFTAVLADGTSVPLSEVAVSVKAWDNEEDGGDDRPIAEAIEAYCYDLLDELHGGYENNDGGFGTFEFNVAAGTVQLTHNDRFTDYDTTEHAI